ncbi:MAG TPA: 2'-5' RNA ligase family protein, partial [Candidatus Saccharimonadales bacterium]|nr:2'-5' RNA ligase family protein [Candidatus Saccharimonadales bacterium]
MQKYVIVKFLEPVADTTEFDAKHWPLHVTLASNFVVDRKAVHLFDKLAELASSENSVTTTASDNDYFGLHKHVHVTTLTMTPELQTLHNRMIALLKSLGATFDEPQYQEEGYRAHATVQADKRLHKGDAVTVDELTVVDMFPDDDISRRRTMRTFKLHSK